MLMDHECLETLEGCRKVEMTSDVLFIPQFNRTWGNRTKASGTLYQQISRSLSKPLRQFFPRQRCQQLLVDIR